MTSIKFRYSGTVRKIRFESLYWQDIQRYVEEAFSISLNSHRLLCVKPVSCEISCQGDLEQLSSCSLIEVEVCRSDESFYSQVIKDLLDIPANKEFVVKKFADIMRIYPSTSLNSLLPSIIETGIKDKLSSLYREACLRTEKKSAFKLVYVNQNGKNVLKGVPSSEWINYSTTNFDALTKSLPPQVIEKLNKN